MESVFARLPMGIEIYDTKGLYFNEDVRKIGKFIREFDDLFQGIDGINAVPGNSKTRRWKFNATNATDDTNNTNATNATE